MRFLKISITHLRNLVGPNLFRKNVLTESPKGPSYFGFKYLVTFSTPHMVSSQSTGKSNTKHNRLQTMNILFYYRPWTSNGKPAIKRLTSRLLFKHLHVNDRWFNWGDKWTSLNCLLDCYNSKCYELIMSLTSRNPLRLLGVRGLMSLGQWQSLHK